MGCLFCSHNDPFLKEEAPRSVVKSPIGLFWFTLTSAFSLLPPLQFFLSDEDQTSGSPRELRVVPQSGEGSDPKDASSTE